MKYTVIVPTYNRARLLQKNLESLANQSVPKEKYEVILVNDGSSDNTDEVVKEFKKTHPDLNLMYIKQINKGVASARNVGIQHAKGEILFFTDDDCVVPPGWIETLVKEYTNHPEVAGVGGWYEYPEALYRNNIYVRFTAWWLQKVYRAHTEQANSNKIKNSRFFNNLAGNTSNMSYRKSVMEETGGFDETLDFVGRVDWELKKRISDLGYPLLYIPYHVLHFKPLGIREVIRKFFNFGRGSYHLAVKNKELLPWYRPTFSMYLYKIREEYASSVLCGLMVFIEFFFTRLGWEYQKVHSRRKASATLVGRIITSATKEWISQEEKKELLEILERRTSILERFRGNEIAVSIYQEKPYLRHAPSSEYERPISKARYDLEEFASYMSIPHDYGSFLYLLVKRLDCGRVLELGTGFGLSALYMLKALENKTGAFLDTIERWDSPFRYYDDVFAGVATGAYRVHRGDIHDILPRLLRDNPYYDLIFIDAGHTSSELAQNVEAILETVPHGCVIAIDDIRWSRQMLDAWNKLATTKTNKITYAATYLTAQDPKPVARIGLLLK